MARFRGRVTGAWTGWIEDPRGSRALLPGCVDDDRVDPDAFPGRWSSVRDFPLELEPLPRVVGNALARAGWWKPGSGDVCSGGAIVGADGASIPPSLDFANDLAQGWSAEVSPTDFIHSLPSTATALMTKLYGFMDYQATLVHGSASGVVALGHALDLLKVGRLQRALVATLSVVTSMSDEMARIAAAVCIETARGDGDVELVADRIGGAEPAEDDALATALRSFGEPAALPLVRLTQALERGEGSFVTHHQGGTVRFG